MFVNVFINWYPSHLNSTYKFLAADSTVIFFCNTSKFWSDLHPYSLIFFYDWPKCWYFTNRKWLLSFLSYNYETHRSKKFQLQLTKLTASFSWYLLCLLLLFNRIFMEPKVVEQSTRFPLLTIGMKKATIYIAYAITHGIFGIKNQRTLSFWLKACDMFPLIKKSS